jgi:hypothetical protein
MSVFCSPATRVPIPARKPPAGTERPRPSPGRKPGRGETGHWNSVKRKKEPERDVGVVVRMDEGREPLGFHGHAAIAKNPNLLAVEKSAEMLGASFFWLRWGSDRS